MSPFGYVGSGLLAVLHIGGEIVFVAAAAGLATRPEAKQPGTRRSRRARRRVYSTL